MALALPEDLSRARDDRVVAGVCGGLARWLGVDPVVVRLATVLLALANAVGVVIYLVAWCLLPVADEAGDSGEADDGAGAQPDEARSLKNAAAVGCITLGLLVLIRTTLPVFPGRVVWPATLAAAGLGVVWARSNEQERARWRAVVAGRIPGDAVALFSGRALWWRLLVGGGLLICGIGWFLHSYTALEAVGAVGSAVLATLLGILVLVGPWIRALFKQLRAERRERIRTEERADMAAHLHDSVLQTLALIQRQAESPQQARSLARRQERELRAWLFDDRTPDATTVPATLAAALDQVSDDVEANDDVTVDVVVVGDRPLDPQVEALVAALREAVVNGARHSGEPEVSVYVEVLDDYVEAFVRDRGKGFDPESVDVHRRGIADSIVGRMIRHGGLATVRSAPGEGTEVMLHLPCGPLEST